MPKKRTPKTEASLPTPDIDPVTEQIAGVSPAEAGEPEASDAPESERRPKGKKGKRGKKEKAARATTAAEGDKKEKREKRNKKDKKAKRDNPAGKQDKSTVAAKLRPLKKVNVMLIEPDGQPRAHFDGELGVLDLLLPKKAEGDDSGV